MAQETLSGFTFLPLEFDKAANIANDQQVNIIKTKIAGGGITDLIVISHGWNNDMDEARNLYARFFQTARRLFANNQLATPGPRQFAVIGILWPSKKFAEQDLIPGGAAGLQVVDTEALKTTLNGLQGVFDDVSADQTLKEMIGMVDNLEDSARACGQFVDRARSLLKSPGVDDEDGPAAFFRLPPETVFERLKQPVPFAEGVADLTEDPAAGLGMEQRLDSEGGAAGLDNFFGGVGAAAVNVLNLTTYYQMKERAGLIGRVGLNPLLRELKKLQPQLRQHLIGHSFGGRLVTAAIAGEDEGSMFEVNTLCLLQAAYSHYGLAEKWDGVHDGIFRRVLSKSVLLGSGVITHTANDKAVGLAYPLASLLAGQVAADLGDANDKYGGMGRNGAQKTPEAVFGKLEEAGSGYQFEAGRLYNLLADKYIKSHGDITGDQVVYAVFQAMI